MGLSVRADSPSPLSGSYASGWAGLSCSSLEKRPVTPVSTGFSGLTPASRTMVVSMKATGWTRLTRFPSLSNASAMAKVWAVRDRLLCGYASLPSYPLMNCGSSCRGAQAGGPDVQHLEPARGTERRPRSPHRHNRPEVGVRSTRSYGESQLVAVLTELTPGTIGAEPDTGRGSRGARGGWPEATLRPSSPSATCRREARSTRYGAAEPPAARHSAATLMQRPSSLAVPVHECDSPALRERTGERALRPRGGPGDQGRPRVRGRVPTRHRRAPSPGVVRFRRGGAVPPRPPNGRLTVRSWARYCPLADMGPPRPGEPAGAGAALHRIPIAATSVSPSPPGAAARRTSRRHRYRPGAAPPP